MICWRDDRGEKALLPVIQLETHVDATDDLRTPRYAVAESGSEKQG